MKRLHLFQAYGIELEYMIVDCDTLKVKPVMDELALKLTGEYANEIERAGNISWSNELVCHVLEMKCAMPDDDMPDLARRFEKSVKEANEALAPYNACLMPTAAHPLMNPMKETKLWMHGQRDIYELYDELFNCQGHGWANLQSTHINLPFYDDEEFARLHTAIRIILPLLPAIAASSPVLDGQLSGYHDTRLTYYQKNQRRIPELVGHVIPERVHSKRGYTKLIYTPIADAIAPYDPEHITEPVWLNSRGAIARFDRGAIEIRLLDIQECPKADMAIAGTIMQLLKALVTGKWISYEDQDRWETKALYSEFQNAVKSAEHAMVLHPAFAEMWGLSGEKVTMQDIWVKIVDELTRRDAEGMAPWLPTISQILEQGTLSSRIQKALAGDLSESNINKIYGQLCQRLQHNELFMP